MKLKRVDIENDRSIFEGTGAETLRLDVVEGMNALVGPNNCGKSNVLRAVAFGLDLEFSFSTESDSRSPMVWAKPPITLHMGLRDIQRLRRPSFAMPTITSGR